jgi:hypothetical protein
MGEIIGNRSQRTSTVCMKSSRWVHCVHTNLERDVPPWMSTTMHIRRCVHSDEQLSLSPSSHRSILIAISIVVAIIAIIITPTTIIYIASIIVIITSITFIIIIFDFIIAILTGSAVVLFFSQR